MGWTEYAATHFYPNGTVNRKAECDAYFEEGLNRGHYKVVKSAMVGTVYYGAIRILKRLSTESTEDNFIWEDTPESEQKTVAVVFLTSVRDKYWFAYKNMDETVGPCYNHAPKSVLTALTPLVDLDYSEFGHQSALAWRQQCYLNANKPKLGQLPIGTRIKYTTYDGEEVILRKHCPAYQFKTPFWYDDETGCYVKKKAIPENFEIL